MQSCRVIAFVACLMCQAYGFPSLQKPAQFFFHTNARIPSGCAADYSSLKQDLHLVSGSPEAANKHFLVSISAVSMNEYGGQKT